MLPNGLGILPFDP